MQGMIFDMQKFALYDGPGIRTVVFLKGCPLKCVWCCNPESQQYLPQIAYRANKCTSCYSCLPVCEKQALQPAENKIKVDFKSCTACGTCLTECPTDALALYGYKADAETIMNEVLKDKMYYENSGGGLTLSGGEPMEQIEFTTALLQQAKANGLHTCIETSGYAPQTDFENILPLTDLFLYDYKHTDTYWHRRYTGKNNDRILSNLDFLYQQNASILIRCPVIPGINNNAEHFKGITLLSRKYPKLKGIEIMPYHDYGTHKYRQIGKSLYPIEAKTVSKEKTKTWIAELRNMGCRNIVQ